METVWNLFGRLKKAFRPRRNRRGSSLAFVMAIGIALVIFVMCLLPMMTTTGTIVYHNMGEAEEYLDSRSAIEFCKSELEKIVEDKIPYTFAVTGSVEDHFTAVPKISSGGVGTNPAYQAIVSSPNAVDDRKDVPISDSVVAICAVEPEETVYDIVITTWANQEKTNTFTATFTPQGSLRIFPEAYGAKQALPLSDFVLVDGQLGTHRIWDSTITMGNATGLGFTETLLPWILPDSPEYTSYYANSGKYPGVLKTTAHAALSDESSNIGEEITDGEMTDQDWYEPEAVAKSKDIKYPGDIWYDSSQNKVYIQGLEAAIELTGEDVEIYYNGSTTEPTMDGVYQISIDYPGTGEYVDGGFNVLPAQGLTMSDDLRTVTVASPKHTLSDAEKQIKVGGITKVAVMDENNQPTGEYTLTVSLTDIPQSSKNLLYGYMELGGSVVWTRSSEIKNLTPGKTYFFYVCRPASVEKGVFYEASAVAKIGMIYKPEFVSTMEAGTYMITTTDESKYLSAANSLTAMTKLNNADGYVFTTGDTPSTWTVTQSGDSWRITQNGSSYLDLTADKNESVSYSNKSDYYDSGFFGIGAHYCYEATISAQYQNPKVSTTSDGQLTISSDGTNFTVMKYLSSVYKYDTHHTKGVTGEGVCSKHSKTESYPYEITMYLNLGSSVSASTSPSSVKFAKVSVGSQPDITAPSVAYTLTGTQITYGTNAKTYVQNHLNPKDPLNQLYVNGVAASSRISAGVYKLIVTTDIDPTEETDLRSAVLNERLTVKKADMSADVLSVTAANDEDDELAVNVSASWHENGGTRYFGYRNAEETEYHWFPADGNSFTFRLDYGTYYFAVKESGTTNYNSMIAEAAEATVIEPKWVELTADQKNDFVFTFDAASGEATWYKLPAKIFPSRVQLVFGIPVGTDGIRWTTTYSSDVRFYGVVVPSTPFGDLEHVLQISQPVGITSVNGRQSSMLRGSSLYFMGKDASINTHGNSIYLTTDLLVLRSPITGGGRVFVNPYTPDDGITYILLFNSEPTSLTVGSATLAPYTIYKVDANKDLNSLTDAYLDGRALGEPTDTDVKYLFRQGVFPEVNLDIAYADDSQLAAIVSGETVGWTNQGNLNGNNAGTDYPKNAVCAYVSEISAAANYTANRILIAGETEAGDDALIVPHSVSFTVRYLSLDTASILQRGSSTYFKVYNLGEDPDFIKQILNTLKLNGFSSKSLQVDYERYTTIIRNDESQIPMQQQICRYDDGTNIFGDASPEELTVRYTTSEIEDLFSQGSIIGSLSGSGVKIIDRYISISCDNGSSMDIGSLIGSDKLSIYTNYIHFDDSIKEIKFSSGLGGSSSDVVISSQESGYNDTEYLVYFQNNSPEKYKGTLLYFEGKTKLKISAWFGISNKEVDISEGFYYIYATTNGTSLTALTDLFTGTDLSENTEQKPYRVDPADLAKYSIYVNEDGTLSDAYVDTGLEDNDMSAVGGFSGGNMG